MCPAHSACFSVSLVGSSRPSTRKSPKRLRSDPKQGRQALKAGLSERECAGADNGAFTIDSGGNGGGSGAKLNAGKPEESSSSMTASSESFEKRAASLKGKHDKSYDAERQKLYDDKVAAGLGAPEATSFEDLIGRLKPDGGFTYDMRNGKTVTSGFAVSINPERETRINYRELSVEQAREMFIQFGIDNAGAFFQPGNYYGGWVDPADGALVLDIAKVLPSIEDARKLGYAANQAGIYDFQVGETIILDSRASVDRGK